MPENYNYGMKNLLTYDEFYYRDYRTQKMLVDSQTGETLEWKCEDKDSLKEFLRIYPEVTVVDQEIPTVRVAIVVQGKVFYDGPNPIGIDLGISTFVMLSDGTKLESIKPLKRYLKKLRREQRRLAKKVKRSNNRKKQRAKVSKVHARVRHIRNDYLHKVSTTIAKNHSLVCVENLYVKGMVKNRKLARAISDQGWSRFVSMLEYKTSWYGSRLVKVGRWFASSKLCSNCGNKKEDLTLKDRVYICSVCGLEIDRDLNAAINILRKGTVGHTETSSFELEKACGDHVRPKLRSVRQRSLKQEPIRRHRLSPVSA